MRTFEVVLIVFFLGGIAVFILMFAEGKTEPAKSATMPEISPKMRGSEHVRADLTKRETVASKSASAVKAPKPPELNETSKPPEVSKLPEPSKPPEVFDLSEQFKLRRRAAAKDADTAALAESADNACQAAQKFVDVEITDWIRQERFEEVEAKSKEFEAAFAQDPLHENTLYILYRNLDSKNEALAATLDKWVQARPSYMSLTARGQYKMSRGYDARGTTYFKDVPEDKVAIMLKLHEEARQDLNKALAQNRAFLPAYCALIKVEMAAGNADVMEHLQAEGVKRNPKTYYLRSIYLETLTPRWGGSYELMDQYTRDCRKLAALNPRIWSLKGENPADKAQVAWAANDYNLAIKYYSEALSYGDNPGYLKSRGQLYIEIKNYEAALQDLLQFQIYGQYLNKEVNYLTVQAITALKKEAGATGSKKGGFGVRPF